MKRKFIPPDNILSALSYKGFPYPGAFIPSFNRVKDTEEFQYDGEAASQKTTANLGAELRKKDALGRFYFLPVIVNDLELPNASIGFQGKKRIIETAMTGRKGSVKELISLEDYEITITGVYTDKDFPEEGLQELAELYEKNESVTLKCALTDIFMVEDDKVVIRSIDIPAEKGTETSQRYTIKLVTDKSFELIIE